MEEIVNRVAKSGLITLDLEEIMLDGDRVELDIKDWLFQEMILKEKDFRLHVKEHDWQQYEGKYVAVNSSADAIIPVWAYMLITTKLKGIAKSVVAGSLEDLEKQLFVKALDQVEIGSFEGAKVVIKGCGNLPVRDFVYTETTNRLAPVVASLMYGEPCSTVPVYKAPRNVAKSV